VRIHVLTDPARGSAGGYTEHELVTLTLTPNEARDLAEALSLLPEGAAAEPPPPTLEERLAAQPDVLAEHDAGYSHAVTVVTWFGGLRRGRPNGARGPPSLARAPHLAIGTSPERTLCCHA
jgi:hypothetical protein